MHSRMNLTKIVRVRDAASAQLSHLKYTCEFVRLRDARIIHCAKKRQLEQRAKYICVCLIISRLRIWILFVRALSPSSSPPRIYNQIINKKNLPKNTLANALVAARNSELSQQKILKFPVVKPGFERYHLNYEFIYFKFNFILSKCYVKVVGNCEIKKNRFSEQKAVFGYYDV